MKMIETLAISGPIGGGKTSAGNIIADSSGLSINPWAQGSRCIIRMSLAEPIKRVVQEMFGVRPDHPHHLKNEPIKDFSPNCPLTHDHLWSPRALWQYIGTNVGRNVDPLLWIKAWEREVATVREHHDRAPRPVLIVCDDLRFRNEKYRMQEQPNPFFLYVERTAKQGLDTPLLERHESEQDTDYLRSTADMVITAPNIDDLLQALTTQVIPLLEEQ